MLPSHERSHLLRHGFGHAHRLTVRAQSQSWTRGMRPVTHIAQRMSVVTLSAPWCHPAVRVRSHFSTPGIASQYDCGHTLRPLVLPRGTSVVTDFAPWVPLHLGPHRLAILLTACTHVTAAWMHMHASHPTSYASCMHMHVTAACMHMHASHPTSYASTGMHMRAQLFVCTTQQPHNYPPACKDSTITRMHVHMTHEVDASSRIMSCSFWSSSALRAVSS